MSVSTMTPRERVLAAMRSGEVDYVPCVPWFNPLFAPQRIGYAFQFPFGPSQRERCEYIVNELGCDAFVNTGIPNVNPAPGVAARVWMEGDVIHKVWTTPAGELSAAVRYDEKWPCGFDIPFFSDFLIGHSVKHWLETEQDVESLRHIIRAPEDEAALARLRFEFIEHRRLAERLQLPTWASCGYGLTGAQHLMGPTELCLAAAERPELVHAYLQLEHEVNLKLLALAAELGVDVICRNGFYETADFYSPAMLEKFLGRRLRAEAAAARAAGLVTTYTINTGLMPIRDYLATIEFDCFNSVDIGFHDFDLATFVASQPERRAYEIGPSGVYHVWISAEATRAAVRKCFEVIGKRGLLIRQCPSAHSIMPWENTLAMVDEWKKLR